MDLLLTIFWAPILIIWVGSFITGFFVDDLTVYKTLKYESYNSIVESKFFKTHLQCVLFYLLQLFVIFLLYPIKISNWINYKTKI